MPRLLRLFCMLGWLCVVGVALCASGPAEAAPARRLKADGRWLAFAIEAPGSKVLFAFEQQSGCAYRLTVEPQTLERPVVDLGFGEAAPQRFGAPARGEPAVHAWQAEGTRLVAAEVSGFSALTGTARIKVEALGPDGEVLARAAPWLGETSERARVGDLLLGEVERWKLVVEPGEAYAIEPTRGEAQGVVLRVLGPDGVELAKSLRPWLPFDPLRVRFPPAAPPPAEGAAARPVLEVRGLGGSGGTYGLRLTRLAQGEALAPPPSQPLLPVTRGALVGEPQGFLANPGDVALLFSPRGPDAMTSAVVEERVGSAWQALGPDAPVGTLRSQEGDHMTVVRIEASGAYRFAPFPPGRAALARPKVISGEHLGGAPLLLGLASDPRTRAKVGAGWRTLGVGVAVPGFDYLFVGEGAPEAGMAMRVRALDGTTLAARPASGEALTLSPGVGPSLRFRAPALGLVLLEAKGGGQVVRPVLRRAAN